MGGAAPWPLGVPGDKGWGQALKPLALAPHPQGLPEGAALPSHGHLPLPAARPAPPWESAFLTVCATWVPPRGAEPGWGVNCIDFSKQDGRGGKTPSPESEQASRRPGRGRGTGACGPTPSAPPRTPPLPTPALHQGLGCPRLGSLLRPAPSARLPSRRGHPRGDGVWVGAADVPMAQERRRRWVSRCPGPRAWAPGSAHLDLGGRGRGGVGVRASVPAPWEQQVRR